MEQAGNQQNVPPEGITTIVKVESVSSPVNEPEELPSKEVEESPPRELSNTPTKVESDLGMN